MTPFLQKPLSAKGQLLSVRFVTYGSHFRQKSIGVFQTIANMARSRSPLRRPDDAEQSGAALLRGASICARSEFRNASRKAD